MIKAGKIKIGKIGRSILSGWLSCHLVGVFFSVSRARLEAEYRLGDNQIARKQNAGIEQKRKSTKLTNKQLTEMGLK